MAEASGRRPASIARRRKSKACSASPPKWYKKSFRIQSVEKLDGSMKEMKRKISGEDHNYEMEPLNRSGLHHRHHPLGKRSTLADLEAAHPAAATQQPFHETLTFWEAVCDRAGWLVGLLILQSLSSFIIKRNESLLTHHGVIVQFLTMLVGAGGNAGNQATVKGECCCSCVCENANANERTNERTN